MSSKSENLRSSINKIIKEGFASLTEMQKGKQFDSYVSFAVSSLTPDMPDSDLDKAKFMKEVEKLLKMKLSQIFLNTFEYPNFYIVKLGNIVLKNNKGETNVPFIKKGEDNIKFSYPYLYVYHDKAEVLKFGSRFFETDEIIIKGAQEFIKNRGINLVTSTEAGKIIVNNDFDTNIVIDMVDWENVKRPVEPKKDLSPKEKNNYRVGRPFEHNLYGKGIIKKTERVDDDEFGNPMYYITADFGGKVKKFKVSKKQSV